MSDIETGPPLGFGEDPAFQEELERQSRVELSHPLLFAALKEAFCWFGPGSAAEQGAKCETKEEMLQQARAALYAATDSGRPMVDELPLSVRAYNCLSFHFEAELGKVRAVRILGIERPGAMKNFGLRSFVEVMGLLRDESFEDLERSKFYLNAPSAWRRAWDALQVGAPR